jgi:hypothetical protein
MLIHQRIGRRGAVLLTLGFAWIMFGVGVLLEEPIPGTEKLLHEQIPGPIRFTLWASMGLFAMANAFAPPRKSDKWGFLALYIMPAERALSYVWGWIGSWDNVDGYSRGWFSAIVWIIVMILVLITSGWKEPVNSIDLRDEDR